MNRMQDVGELLQVHTKAHVLHKPEKITNTTKGLFDSLRPLASAKRASDNSPHYPMQLVAVTMKIRYLHPQNMERPKDLDFPRPALRGRVWFNPITSSGDGLFEQEVMYLLMGIPTHFREWNMNQVFSGQYGSGYVYSMSYVENVTLDEFPSWFLERSDILLEAKGGAYLPERREEAPVLWKKPFKKSAKSFFKKLTSC